MAPTHTGIKAVMAHLQIGALLTTRGGGIDMGGSQLGRLGNVQRCLVSGGLVCFSHAGLAQMFVSLNGFVSWLSPTGGSTERARQ